jgi:hypothetical protein
MGIALTPKTLQKMATEQVHASVKKVGLVKPAQKEHVRKQYRWIVQMVFDACVVV